MKREKTVLLKLSVAVVAGLITVSGALAESLSPKESYLKYRTALASAGRIEDLSSFMCKKVLEEIKNTPAEMKPMMFGLMKETTPKHVKVLSEEIKGDAATLTLTSLGDVPLDKDSTETSKGLVTFVKEDGDWKLNKESWSIKVESK